MYQQLFLFIASLDGHSINEEIARIVAYCISKTNFCKLRALAFFITLLLVTWWICYRCWNAWFANDQLRRWMTQSDVSSVDLSHEERKNEQKWMSGYQGLHDKCWCKNLPLYVVRVVHVWNVSCCMSTISWFHHVKKLVSHQITAIRPPISNCAGKVKRRWQTVSTHLQEGQQSSDSCRIWWGLSLLGSCYEGF